MTTLDEHPDAPGAGRFYDPASAAFIAFPLAVLCLFSSSALTGLVYTLPLLSRLGPDSGDSARLYLFAGYLLSALFAAVPLVLGRVGLSRLVAADAWWVSQLLRAAVFLSLLAIALRLVSGVLVLVDDNYAWTGILPTRV